jgi:hypothetical protein
LAGHVGSDFGRRTREVAKGNLLVELVREEEKRKKFVR